MQPVVIFNTKFSSCIHYIFFTPSFKIEDWISTFVFTPVIVYKLLIGSEVHVIKVDRVFEMQRDFFRVSKGKNIRWFKIPCLHS